MTASSLLKMDREYQVAAAKFYAGDYDGAIAGFEAVVKDISSPWQPWGEYLAARAEVRKAMITAAPGEGGEQATFDPALLKKARTRLEKVTAVSGDRMHHAAEAELNFIEVRLDPQKRLNDSAVALAGPAPDAEFAQHLADMRFLTDHGETGDADLLRWMGYGDDDNKTRPIGLGKGDLDAAEWKKRQTEPWLVAALMQAKAKDVGVADLLGAAAKVPAGSPAYVTVSYQRARLMLESGDHTAARKLTTTVLAGLNGEGTDATRNALLGLRIQTANAYAEFLADAPRALVPSNTMSQAANVAICEDSVTPPGCVKKIPPLQFDSDAAQAFNRQLPLARWVEAAKAKELPEHLRGAIAMAAWLRAQGLGDETTVKVMAPMLPAPMHTAAGDGTGFPVILALLRNPGIRPYLEQGVQRSVSYKVQDEFRDNWWCAKWSGPPDQVYDTVVTVVPPMPLGFLSDAEKHVETEEKKKLDALPFGVVWLGQQAIEFVKTRPDDKDAAEALALTVRATRFGCYIGDDKAATALDQKAVSKEAFNILHKQYPKSPWTAKTPYYY
jgi:hypothetical protein